MRKTNDGRPMYFKSLKNTSDSAVYMYVLKYFRKTVLSHTEQQKEN